ncbi:MAG: prephenate dehydrogenase/arogenate dehydrogenase family protein [Candidatus Rokubacteria bacterium]|nr:prephenate dehydrogenase/arogenate dehydrogenase family protein [Candidatus Rokubacteria bacterium]
MIERLAIVGLGLLGGSVAKAVRAEGLAREIVAVGRSREGLDLALTEGAVDRVTTDLADGLRGADLCLLATPVTTLVELLPAVWHRAAPDAVITDVGSTKAALAAAAEGLHAARPLAFVGSHPMAGSEQSGYRASRPDLFRGALVIITPTGATPPDAQKRVTGLWESLGARVTAMDPETHDRAAAAISHLPHLVADALVDAVLRMDPAFLALAARGFRDTTRIAAANPEVWREIFAENRVALGEALGAFRGALDDLERLVAAGDPAAVEAELARIRRARESLG